MSWSLDAMLGAISSAAKTCGATKVAVPKADYGSCVGEVLGAAGFIAASGVNTWNAANNSCLSALEPEDIVALSPREKDLVNGRCAQLSSSTARTMSIAAAKASEAVGHCSGMVTVTKNARCGRAVALGLAALAGAAEGASFMSRECGNVASCCSSTAGNPLNFTCDCTAEVLEDLQKARARLKKRCARFASSTLKELAMVWTMMSEASAECSGDDISSKACSHFLGGTFAGFFFFSEAISRQTLRCKDTKETPITFFDCSQDMGFMGEGIDTMASAIGAAIRDCAFGFGPTKRQSSWLGFGRRYFLP